MTRPCSMAAAPMPISSAAFTLPATSKVVGSTTSGVENRPQMSSSPLSRQEWKSYAIDGASSRRKRENTAA